MAFYRDLKEDWNDTKGINVNNVVNVDISDDINSAE